MMSDDIQKKYLEEFHSVIGADSRKWADDRGGTLDWYYWYDNIERLFDGTGIYPSDKVGEEVLETLLKEGKSGWLLDVNEAKLGPALQTKYRLLASEGKIKDIKLWLELTRDKPEIPDSCAQMGCEKLIQSRDYSSIVELVKITQVKPDLSNRTVQDAYMHLANTRQWSVINDLLGIVEIKPDEQAMQTVYKGLVKDGEYKAIEKFRSLTKISPTGDIVIQEYFNLVQKGRLDQLQELRLASEVEPVEAVYERVNSYMRNPNQLKRN